MKHSIAQRSIEGPVNRPLTNFEQVNRLDNHILGKGIPLYQSNAIIRFNSTFLEIPQDGFSNNRFVFSFSALFLLFMIAALIYFMASFFMVNASIKYILLLLPFLLGLGFLEYLILQVSFFNYTHRPIRFNRKKQCVHFFRFNGTQITVPWKDIVFTCSKKNSQPCIYVTANIIDKETGFMTERFFLPEMTTSSPFFHPPADRYYYPDLVSLWAFIVEYMEGDNLPKLSGLVYYCLPFDKKKENIYWSFLMSLRLLDPQFRTYYFNIFFIGDLLFFPISFPIRVLSTWTNKLPKWRQEIEAQCQVDAYDSINLSSETNPTGWKLFRYVTGMLKPEEFRSWLKDMENSESLSRQ
ncbi:DUF6708 domain-containing protein [Thorsellia anophelis]|uniref:DUF6708 domain-containing protein n=1 Tax=Thorsellia anophelis DSM 18579 TaxID=1123402 RepID=A0A1I0FGK7_9GAMM|nr:DUF6708 domain-containing protein [Thorsellia anophelis]SET57236.1 hypothetical protein SAMN02583745_02757 [Thorsellia anophelis DSM 18579]